MKVYDVPPLSVSAGADRAIDPSGRRRSSLWMLLALAIAAAAQGLLHAVAHVPAALILFALALAVFLIALGPWDRLPLDPVAQAVRRPLPRTLRWSCAQAAGWCTFIAITHLGGGVFDRIGTSAWVASVVLAVLAFGELPGRATARSERADDARARSARPVAPHVEAMLLAAILVLAAALLFSRLDHTPADPTSDHAEKLLDVRDVLSGARPIFFAGNGGREAAIFYWTALWSGALGFGYRTLKFSTAVLGLLCIAATYRFARELFGPVVAAAASFLLAVSSWHLTISRIGLRFPFAPLASALALGWLFRALRTNRRNDWLLAGLALGAAQYGYTSARILFVLFAVWVVLRVTLDRTPLAGGVARVAAGVATASLVAFLVALPMLCYAYAFPERFFHRSLTRTTSLEVPLRQPALWQFLDNVRSALLMFNWRGETNWFVCGNGQPMLDPVTAALFALGLGYLMWLVLRRRDSRPLYLVSALLILIVPSALALAFPVENPSANRAAIVLPVVMTIAALPIGVLLARVMRSPTRRPDLVVACALLVAGIVAVATNAHRYFVDCDRIYRAWTPNSEEIAAAARQFVGRGGSLGDVYLINWPHWVDVRLIGLAAGDFRWANLLQSADAAQAHAAERSGRLYILHPADTASLTRLRAIEPRGADRLIHSVAGKDFVLFEVPRAE